MLTSPLFLQMAARVCISQLPNFHFMLLNLHFLPSDQSESVLHGWLNVGLSLVTYRGGSCSRCQWVANSAALYTFQWQPEKSAILGMIKELHYLPSYYIQSFSCCHFRPASGNQKPVRVNTSRPQKKKRGLICIGMCFIRTSLAFQRFIDSLKYFQSPVTYISLGPIHRNNFQANLIWCDGPLT